MMTKGKLLQLFCMAYVCFDMGALLSIIGPTLPDLQCFFKTGLNEMSFLFLSLGLAGGVASLLFPFFVKKCNIYVLMATMMLLYSSAAMVAIAPFIQIAVIVLFIAGFATGVSFVGTLHLCKLLFPDNAYVLHIVVSAASAGSLLTPILAMPFLGRPVRNVTTPQPNISTVNTSLKHHFNKLICMMQPDHQVSNTSENLSTEIQTYCYRYTSSVNFVYILIGSLGLPLTIAYTWSFFRSDCNVINTSTLKDSYNQVDSLRSPCEFVFIFLLILSFPLVYGLAYTYVSYITTVATERPLNLSAQRMAVLTSLFWLHVLLGRLASTAASFRIRQIKILYICFAGAIIAMILLTASENRELCLWFGTLSLGFFLGPTYAALLAWSGDYIAQTPCILGILVLSDWIGSSLLPFISGQLINLYGIQVHDYFCLFLTVLQLAIFCVLHGLGSVMKLQREKNPDGNNIEIGSCVRDGSTSK